MSGSAAAFALLLLQNSISIQEFKHIQMQEEDVAEYESVEIDSKKECC